MHLGDASPVALELPAQPAPQPPAPPVKVKPLEPLGPTGPYTFVPPQTLLPELIARIRTSGTTALSIDTNVRPAGGSGAASAAPLHGALKPDQTVVYVLDCSGSMGAANKFVAARTALVATLRAQPETVRFQVIVYAGTARILLPSDGTAPAATEANIRVAATKLAEVEPRGASNHPAAVRAALRFRPDVIFLLTDADDLTAAMLKPVLALAAKPVAVCVGQVTGKGVQRPRELR